MEGWTGEGWSVDVEWGEGAIHMITLSPHRWYPSISSNVNVLDVWQSIRIGTIVQIWECVAVFVACMCSCMC